MAYFISSFSEKCGVNKESIRYYERKNLLPEPDRTNSGYRVYSEEDVKRVNSLNTYKKLAFL